MTKIIEIEKELKHVDVNREDFGTSLYVDVDTFSDDSEEAGMWVQIKSHDMNKYHLDFMKLIGKKVRVTVEIVEDKPEEEPSKETPITYDNLVAIGMGPSREAMHIFRSGDAGFFLDIDGHDYVVYTMFEGRQCYEEYPELSCRDMGVQLTTVEQLQAYIKDPNVNCDDWGKMRKVDVNRYGWNRQKAEELLKKYAKESGWGDVQTFRYDGKIQYHHDFEFIDVPTSLAKKLIHLGMKMNVRLNTWEHEDSYQFYPKRYGFGDPVFEVDKDELHKTLTYIFKRQHRAASPMKTLVTTPDGQIWTQTSYAYDHAKVIRIPKEKQKTCLQRWSKNSFRHW